MKLHIPSGVDLLPALSRRAFVQILITYIAVTAIVTLCLWQGWGGPRATRILGDVAALAAIVFAAACAAAAARACHGRARRGWLAMIAGLTGWAAGAIVTGYFQIGLGYERAPFPSWADAGHLLFPIGAGATVLLLAPSDRGQTRTRLVLDGVIVAASVFLVSWVTVLEGVFRSGIETRVMWMALAYPLADIVVITIAWSRAVAAFRISLGLVVAALVMIAVSDSLFAAVIAADSHHPGNMVNLGLIIGCGLLGFGALKSIGERPVDPTMNLISSHARLWIPYVPLMVACVIGLVDAAPNLGSAPLVGAGALLVVTVLVRQFIVLGENRRLLADVARLAFRDQLTGLANRALFLDRLDQAVARLRRDNESFALICLDLDDFKMVNDELGHPAGDELLIRVAQRITGCLRDTDTVARVGGDEFAMFITGSYEDALVAAERVLDCFTEPIVIDGVSLTVRPSIGMTIASPEAATTTVDELLRHADLAMYAAKRAGGGCVRNFAPDLTSPYELPGKSTGASNGRAEAASAAMRSAAAGVATLQTTQPHPVYSSWPPTAVRWALGALLIGVLGFGVGSISGVLPQDTAAVQSWSLSVLLLSAAALVAIRVYRVSDERLAWSAIAVGMAAAGIGTLVHDLTMSPTWPSIADPLFLMFYPAVYLGLLLFLRSQLGRIPTPVRLDGLVVLLTAGAVGATLATGPFSAAVAESPAAVVISLSYPIAGVLLLTLAAESTSLLGWRSEWRWGLITVGALLWVLAAAAYLIQPASGSPLGGTWMDAFWPATFAMVAIASWLPRRQGVRHRDLRVTPLAVPIVCTFVALAVAVYAAGERLPVTLAALSLTVIAVRYALTFRDASALAESHEHAMTDDLTGLANRRSLATALTAEPLGTHLSSTKDRATTRIGLLLVDVDEFGEINNSFHRSVGDLLLRGIAARLSRTVRPRDLVARTGSDEFAILLIDNVNLMTARAVAGAIIDALRPPFVTEHLTLQIDVNIVIAMWPDHCAHPQELLNLAEAALPAARTAEGRVTVYDPAADAVKDDDVQPVEDLRAVLLGRADGDAGRTDLPLPAQDQRIR